MSMTWFLASWLPPKYHIFLHSLGIVYLSCLMFGVSVLFDDVHVG